MTALAAALAALFLTGAAFALAALPAHAAAPPPGFIGVQGWDQMTAPQLKLVADTRITTYRMLVLWRKVEPTKPVGDCRTGCRHTYRWSYYDDLFRRAAERGVRVLPVLHGAPAWSGAARPQYQPTDPSGKRAFVDFAQAAAQRYGPEGRRWTLSPWSAAAPAPPAVRSTYWQVWNEPNIRNYWRPQPNAAQYATMLKGVSAGLRRASPQVRVVAAGLPWPAVGIRADTYLNSMLKVEGLKAAVDVFAIHPYARYVTMPGQEDVIDHIGQARNVLVARGAGTKQLWITEIGWASGTPDGRFTVSERQQRDYLDDLYRRVLSMRRSYRLLGAVWFSFKDVRAKPGQEDYWGYRSGLFRYGGISSPKPSWRTLRARALNGY